MTDETANESANSTERTPSNGDSGEPEPSVQDGGTATGKRDERTTAMFAEIDEQATDGLAAARETEAIIEDLAIAASQVRGNVTELQEQVGEIATVVDVITDIAEQTNILALNANIEAGRAGEDSEGFAVVGDEVKQLAEEAHDRTAEIEAVVDSIDQNTEETVSNLAKVNEHISEGIGSSQRAASHFEAIQEVLEAHDRPRGDTEDGPSEAK